MNKYYPGKNEIFEGDIPGIGTTCVEASCPKRAEEFSELKVMRRGWSIQDEGSVKASACAPESDLTPTLD